MGKRGPSKSDQILQEARNRVAKAQQQVTLAEGQLSVLNGILAAHKSTLDALEKQLAKAPRKKKKTGPVALPDNPDNFLKDAAASN